MDKVGLAQLVHGIHDSDVIPLGMAGIFFAMLQHFLFISLIVFDTWVLDVFLAVGIKILCFLIH